MSLEQRISTLERQISSLVEIIERVHAIVACQHIRQQEYHDRANVVEAGLRAVVDAIQ